MFNNEIVLNEVKELVAENVEVKLVRIDKGNGVILEGVNIKANDSNVAPVIYFDYNSADEIAEAKRIYRLYEGYKVNANVDMSYISDYEKVKKDLRIKLSSHPAKELVSKTAFADIYMTAYLVVDCIENGTIGIKQEFLDTWNIDKETLFADALESSKENEPAKVMGLGQMVSELTNNDLMFGDPEINTISVLTNNSKVFGASAIMYANLPKEFYMIPSSVHEVLIIPGDMIGMMGPGEHELTEMVKAVNETEVLPAEVLADHAYHYVDGEYKVIA